MVLQTLTITKEDASARVGIRLMDGPKDTVKIAEVDPTGPLGGLVQKGDTIITIDGVPCVGHQTALDTLSAKVGAVRLAIKPIKLSAASKAMGKKSIPRRDSAVSIVSRVSSQELTSPVTPAKAVAPPDPETASTEPESAPPEPETKPPEPEAKPPEPEAPPEPEPTPMLAPPDPGEPIAAASVAVKSLQTPRAPPTVAPVAPEKLLAPGEYIVTLKVR